MGFANPVPGRIQGPDEPWAGVGTFIVTSSFQEHIDSGRGAGIDLGDGRCGDPVFAMEAGSVSFAGMLGAAQVVRILHPQVGPANETGYAHLSTIEVGFGQSVAKGQRIGTVGMTGADACHLHGGYKINGVETDWWPLLDQNIMAPEMDTTIVRYPSPRTWYTKGGTLTGRRLDPAPLSVSGNFGAGSPAHSSAEYEISPTPAGWPAGPYQLVIDGALAGYLVANSDVKLDPVPVCPPSTGGGFTQADIDAAVAERDREWEAKQKSSLHP